MTKRYIVSLLFFIPLVAPASEKEIYFELLSLASYSIPIERNSCEVEKEGYRVGDFLSEYLQFMAEEPARTTMSLSCDNSNGVSCTFSYGQKAKWLGSESWGRILKFKYDAKAKKINETTIVCIDIP